MSRNYVHERVRMGVLGVALAPMLLASAGEARAPAEVQGKAVGTLAQVMRGIYFPNANLIFDVQSTDPGAPPSAKNENEGGASARFANIYSGWQVVENAAIALAESSDLLLYPGRLCQNGKPVPVGRADWAKYVQGMKDAGVAALQVARTRNLENMIEVTNTIADACSNCHEPYRDRGEANSPARCTPPTAEQQERINRGLR
jgi:hypothetical protein